MSDNSSSNDIIECLKLVGAIKHFPDGIILKSGKTSNVYVDLRVLTAHPAVLRKIANKLASEIESAIPDVKQDRKYAICGLPYGAIPLATLIADELGVSSVVLRKERKKHGTGKMLEGLMEYHKTIILIDDVLTSGTSIAESVETLQQNHPELEVKHAFVVVDRQEERNSMFELLTNTKSMKTHHLLTLHDIGSFLFKRKTLSERAMMCNNDVTKRLFEIADRKQSRVIISIDNPSPDRVLEIADQTGENVCCVKLHFDTLDFSTVSYDVDEFFRRLNVLKERDEWLLFEDRKYLDTANTVDLQHRNVKNVYGGSLDLVTAFAIASEKTIKAIEDIDKDVGILLIAELSTKGSLIAPQNYNRCISLSRKYNSVSGVICQSRPLNSNDNIAYITPGVSIFAKTDGLDQRYRSPHIAIKRDRCDFIVVGRGICEESHPKKVSLLYRNSSWI